jgi:hypothetical protein
MSTIVKRIKVSISQGGGAKEILTAIHPAVWTSVKWIFWVPFCCAVLFVVVLWGIEQAALYLAPTTRVGYFLEYSTFASGGGIKAKYDQVVVDKRPHDCEWGSAPLGAKHCHYDARVQSVRTAIGTDGSTPIVSYDEGKTWSVTGRGEEPSIFVSWTKVDE